ncbi:hypothetical protein HMPREF1982_04332 [Clostridiales bacterium oral taxon 876 str. F0540]|nr:hypothetical protein HMPREF1982_04332 [Clostridiales bacterium oral taxon 876 str. F0540]
MLAIFAIAEETLKNTKGTIIVNIKFKNKFPKGSSIAAFGPKIAPAIPPNKTEPSRITDDL